MSVSIEQFFNEAQAVCRIIDEWVKETEPEEVDEEREEFFTALWQAVELMSRAVSYIHAQVMAEAATSALYLPAPVERKGTLYGPGGEPL